MAGARSPLARALLAAAMTERDAHARTTQLVRLSLLAGVRYGKYGLSRQGTR